VIRSEKVSRTSTPGREELKTILAFIHKGDMLVVTRLDRLARSIADLAIIVRELGAKGRIAQGKPIDTGSVAGRAFLQMLGVFAEFETAIRRERQLEGISAAPPRSAASIRGGRRRSTPKESRPSAKKGWGPARSPSGSKSAAPASTG
jgi:DNA invertase Pin-like site-specific DNA recombinase